MTSPADRPDNSAAEVAALQARISELEGQVEARADASPPAGRTGWWRPVLVVLLLVVAAVLAPLSVVATWAHDQVGDTEAYVETVAPLASDPAVQEAITDRVTDEIIAAIDPEALTSEALSALAGQSFVPDRASDLLPSLAVPLSNAIETFVHDRVAQFVESDAFQDAWVEANRQAHEQMVAVLTGGENLDSVTVRDGSVSINIAVLVEAVKQRLVEEGFDFAERIPTVSATFTVFHAENIGTAQKLFALLDTLARVLPVVAILLVVAAVLVARDRRKTVLAAGLAVAASMVLLGLLLNLVRPAYLDAVPAEVMPADAAAVIYDQVVSFIRTALRAVGIVFIALAVAAFYLAPTGAGAATRRGVGSALSGLRQRATGAGMDIGPVGRFFGTYRAVLRWVAVGLAALVYLSLERPTGRDALVIIAVTVVVLLVIEFLAVPEPEESDVPADLAEPRRQE